MSAAIEEGEGEARRVSAAPPSPAEAVPPCPLCGGRDAALFHREDRAGVLPRDYLRCPACALVFVPAAFHLSPAAEKAEYDRHRNDPADPGYRRFLAGLAEPLAARLAPGARGFDFGCGPGPALSTLLAEAGFECADFDPLYRPDPTVFERAHDFIASTEVFEHLARPGEVLTRLVALLKPGGLLAVMTGRVRDRAAFARWNYTRDPTHIAFYSDATFAFIACRWGLEATFAAPTVVLLRRPSAAS